MRNIVKFPGKSCDEREHKKVLANEMKKFCFTSVIDKMGNKYSFIGIGKRIFAFDSLIDTEGFENRNNWKFEPYEEFEDDYQIGPLGVSD